MASALPVSLLSDSAGPGGVPLMIAGLMASAGAVLMLRAALVGPGAASERPDHRRAAGLAGVFWLMFVVVLGIPFPVGSLFGGL